MNVLDAAWEIKHKKSQISSKFARDSAKPFQKSLRFAGLAGSLGRTWGKGGSLPQAGKSSNTEGKSVALAATSSLTKAPKNSGKPINTSTSVNSNVKFIPTSTKPAGWVKKWYKLEGYS